MKTLMTKARADKISAAIVTSVIAVLIVGWVVNLWRFGVQDESAGLKLARILGAFYPPFGALMAFVP